MLARTTVPAFILAGVVGMSLFVAGAARAAEPAATYGQDLKLLSEHTDVLELADERGGRVAICPQFQGRVMTSTVDGPAGRSFGWINRQFIASGKKDPLFNNYGGEDRFWLSPEAGQFALFFAPGAKPEPANWRTPPGLNEGGFRLASGKREPFYRLTARRQFVNASNTPFDIEIARTIRLVSPTQTAELLGRNVPELLALASERRSAIKSVGFATENTITNAGAAMTKKGGLVSIWTLGQFPPGPSKFILVPYLPGEDAQLGPILTSDYFGEIPADRLKILPTGIVFKGDGSFRAKIGVSPRRARPVLGAIDFEAGTLTIVHFTLPADAPRQIYLNNAWVLPQPDPFHGDVANSYNDGPAEPGAATLGGFFELETLSHARELATGDSLTHVHSTFHFQAEIAELDKLANGILGIDLDEVLAAFR